MDLQQGVEAECWAFGCCQELCGGSQSEHGALSWDGQASNPAVHWDSGVLPVTRTEESQDLQGSSGRPWGVQTSLRNWNNLPEGRTGGPPTPTPTPVPGKIGLKGPAWHLNKPPSVKAVCLLSVGCPLPHLCIVKRPLLIDVHPGEAPAASALGPLLYNHPSVPLVGEEVPLSPRPPSPHPSTQHLLL